MHELYLNSTRDTFLVAIPFVFILALSLFRLDTIFGASRRMSHPRRPPCGMDEHGEPLLIDPDGRPSEPRRKRD
jgi:hypothetical protein